MRQLVAGALLILVAATGCTSSGEPTPDDGRSTTTTSAPPAPDPQGLIYLIERESRRLVGVPARVPTEDVKPPEVLAALAVEALMAKEEQGPRYDNLWNGICRVGTGVESVVSRPSVPLVVVSLTGARGGALCDMSPKGRELQRQQLAWTIVRNLGVDDSTTVRVQGASGSDMLEGDVTPDPTYLAP